MLKNITRLLFSLSLFQFLTAENNPWPNPSIKPPKGHPRLYLRSENLPKLKTRLNDPGFSNYVTKMRSDSELKWDKKLKVASSGATYDPKLHDRIEACAARFLFEDNLEMGKKAVEMVTTLLPQLVYPNETDITRGKGATIHTAAIVYDWCYSLLSETDKQTIIREMKRIAKQTEVGYPPTGGGDLVGHTGEAQIFRDQLSAGIAVYDEDEEIYQYSAGRLFSGLLPARNFVYESGWYHQGSMYGRVRLCWELWTAAIYQRMTGASIFSPTQLKMAENWIYSRRPDGQFFVDGDAGPIALNSGEDKGDPHLHWIELFTVFLSDDPHLAQSLRDNLKRKDRLTDTLPWFLFGKPDAPVKPLATLPTTKYFPDPAGILSTRTSWESGPAVPVAMAQLKLSPWMFNNHQHLDSGKFQLWYRGPISVDSGYYQGSDGGYGSKHWFNYYQRSIAHNTLLVRDPSETETHGRGPTSINCDGGQRWPSRGDEPGTLAIFTNADYRVGEILGTSIGPDKTKPIYSHLCGRIDNYGAKVENATRSFVFFSFPDTKRPGALIVYDRLRASDPTFQKVWVMHSLSEPVVEPSAFSILSGRGGKCTANILLPTLNTYELKTIGGPGKEFLVGDVNYPQVPKIGTNCEGQGFRIELSSTAQEKQTHFLVALQLHDEEGTVARKSELISSDLIQGIRLGERTAIFPKADAYLKSAFQFEIPGQESSWTLITGLEAGPWEIKNGDKTTELVVSKAAHTIWLELMPGKVACSKKL